MRKTLTRIIIFLSILGLSALACQTAGEFFGGPTFVPTFVSGGDAPTVLEPAGLPIETVQPETSAGPQVLSTPDTQTALAGFLDDFSDENSGWTKILTNEGGADYADGGYRIFIQKENHLLWVTSGNQFENVRVQVDARLLEGGLDNNYGVLCRYQDDNNFYALVISSDGYFAIRKRVGGGALETIIGDRFQFSDQIRLGEQENSLMAECDGAELRLYVNGEKIAETTDTDFQAGDVGLLAGTFSATSIEILFDNFSVVEMD